MSIAFAWMSWSRRQMESAPAWWGRGVSTLARLMACQGQAMRQFLSQRVEPVTAWPVGARSTALASLERQLTYQLGLQNVLALGQREWVEALLVEQVALDPVVARDLVHDWPTPSAMANQVLRTSALAWGCGIGADSDAPPARG